MISSEQKKQYLGFYKFIYERKWDIFVRMVDYLVERRESFLFVVIRSGSGELVS